MAKGGEQTTGKASPAKAAGKAVLTDDNVKLLISCLKNGRFSRPDFDAVAIDCNISNKAAAMKRFERLLAQFGTRPSELYAKAAKGDNHVASEAPLRSDLGGGDAPTESPKRKRLSEKAPKAAKKNKVQEEAGEETKINNDDEEAIAI